MTQLKQFAIGACCAFAAGCGHEPATREPATREAGSLEGALVVTLAKDDRFDPVRNAIRAKPSELVGVEVVLHNTSRTDLDLTPPEPCCGLRLVEPWGGVLMAGEQRRVKLEITAPVVGSIRKFVRLSTASQLPGVVENVIELVVDRVPPDWLKLPNGDVRTVICGEPIRGTISFQTLEAAGTDSWITKVIAPNAPLAELRLARAPCSHGAQKHAVREYTLHYSLPPVTSLGDHVYRLAYYSGDKCIEDSIRFALVFKAVAEYEAAPSTLPFSTLSEDKPKQIVIVASRSSTAIPEFVVGAAPKGVRIDPVPRKAGSMVQTFEVRLAPRNRLEKETHGRIIFKQAQDPRRTVVVPVRGLGDVSQLKTTKS